MMIGKKVIDTKPITISEAKEILMKKVEEKACGGKTKKYQNGDKICTIGMQCIYRKNVKRLDYIVYMRSNNVCEYTQDSLWQCKIFTIILKTTY